MEWASASPGERTIFVNFKLDDSGQLHPGTWRIAKPKDVSVQLASEILGIASTAIISRQTRSTRELR